MKNKYLKLTVLAFFTVGIMTSCYKEFNPKSYQPPFTINGYTSVADIGKGSLIAYWSFDGSYIDSVSNIAGTGVGTSLTGGFLGQAFQGTNNGYVISDLPAAVKNVTSFTIDYWLNTANVPSDKIITPICISKDDDFWGSLDMFYETTGRTDATANLKIHIFGQREVWFTTGWIPNPWSSWVNIALTYDASTSTFTLYKSGSAVATQQVEGLGNFVFPTTATKIIFGTEQFQCSPSIGTAGSTQGWAGYLTGQMDEVRIYNKALNASDIQALIVLQGKGK